MHDFILGADFLRENSAIIDYNANALSLADGLVSLPLQNYDTTQISVRTVEAICIPSYTEAIVPVFCPRRFTHTAILIEPFPRFQFHGLATSRSFSQCENGKTVCKILNDNSSGRSAIYR